MIDIAKKYLREMHQGAFDDERLKVVISEGRTFLGRGPNHSYDAIIADVTDPVIEGLSCRLFTGNSTS